MNQIYTTQSKNTTKKRLNYERFAIIPKFIFENPKLPFAVARLYMYLKSLDPCFPSYLKISEKTGMTKMTIRKSIKWMVDNNVLAYKKGDNNKSNKYTFIDQQINEKNDIIEVQNLYSDDKNEVQNLYSGGINNIPPEVQNLYSDEVQNLYPNSTMSLTLQLNSTTKKEKNKRKSCASVETEVSTHSSPEKLVEIWNRIVNEKGLLSKVRVINDKIKRDIAKTSKTLLLSESDWELYFYSIYNSKFLLGTNDRRWQASFAWAINETNAAKVINGNYFDRGSAAHETSDETKRALKSIFNTDDAQQYGDYDVEWTTTL